MTSGLRILVTGTNGQLGQELAGLAKHYADIEWHFLDRSTLDLSETTRIAPTIAAIAPQVIVNAAAYTAVDKAESEGEIADAINHIAVREIANTAKALDACLIQVSTDYVFDGTHHRPYLPSDTPSPESVYGATKLAGEKAFIGSGAKGIVLRTSWVYSALGKNFVGTMLRLGREKDALGVVADQVGSPTWAKDLARAIIRISLSEKLQNTKGEIYHYSNTGVCSWFDLATCIMDESGLDCSVNPIASEAYPTPAKRPHYSVLNCQSTLDDFSVETPHWLHSLRLALPEFATEKP
ncbi:dTDP-4-dehydrorhamnose reductase [Gilvimarinus algae]|uniref:dTDP-4-dehydrorhamnose reductase n=1 Tax=Gilvimarinus algae TaxID=3058037 RepID=A0ABT8TI26_9GAMM|nr:dTDP-4-dehydrorhamnose reductase [Gilvimarinus sp. SDUM040014]MDO3383586.1 dTDP-4-dehydrorhamnose reductase [Gilvimarinus sp. SDUM040014]